MHVVVAAAAGVGEGGRWCQRNLRELNMMSWTWWRPFNPIRKYLIARFSLNSLYSKHSSNLMRLPISSSHTMAPRRLTVTMIMKMPPALMRSANLNMA